MKAVLLYTERPVLVDRELDTHSWLLEVAPWKSLDLELLYDNAPGGWMRYFKVFRKAWEHARELRVPLINLESDIVPTMQAFRQHLDCKEPYCTTAYPYREYSGDSTHVGGSGIVGSGPYLALEGQEFLTAWCDIGLVRFSRELMGRLPMEFFPKMESELDGLFHRKLYHALRSVDPDLRIHVHWPAVRNNHTVWDSADWAHLRDP